MKSSVYQSMLMQAPVGFAMMRGRDLVFDLVNPTYSEMIRGRAIVGMRYRDAFPELAGTGTFELLEGVFDTGESFTAREYEVPLERDGAIRNAYFDFSVHAVRGDDGAVTGLLGIAVEVTELVVRRMEAEALAAQLRASEQRFRGAQETSLDAFIVLRSVVGDGGRVTDFEFVFQNDAAFKINGLDPASVVGSSLLAHFPGLRGSELWEVYVRTAETGEPCRVEVFYDRDGYATWFRVLTSRIGDGIAISFSDVSERKRIEEAERRAREQAEFLATDVIRQSGEMQAALLEMRAERDRALARLAELEAGIRA